MPVMHGNKLLVWGNDIDPKALEQAERSATLPFIVGHVALMPDAHWGMGATIGSVIPTVGAIVPAAVGVDIGCVDRDTEFLSPDGWVKISEWNEHKIAQWDLFNHSVSFVAPDSFIKRESSGFYHLKTKYGIDQMISKDHRIIVWNPEGRERRWFNETIAAEEFVQRHNARKAGTKARFNTGCQEFETSSTLPWSDDIIRVQIMVNADGHQTKGGAVVLKLRKQRKIDRAEKLLTNAGIEYTEHTNAEGDVIFRFTPALRKDDWALLWGASRWQIEAIVDEVFHWDGNLADRVFYSRNKEAANFIQYAFFVDGWRAVMRSDERDGAVDYRVFAYENTLVGIESNPTRNEIPFVPSQDGYEYCFQVPTTYWVMRRNGQIAITGNCGMIAVETKLNASDLPDDLGDLLSRIEQSVPAGVGQGHDKADYLIAENESVVRWGLADKASKQMGTLGSGNHFVEVCLDPDDGVWVVLHSGSRGVGNKLAMRHIKVAKNMMERYFIELPDPDLAYLIEGTKEFGEYMRDLHWAQAYALKNREVMMDAVLRDLAHVVGPTPTKAHVRFEQRRINCHHNYTAKEHHNGRDIWVTRKGAIRARVGDYGVIPGSMGTSSFIVKGLGNKSSFDSSAHGAGRRMSRTQAKKDYNEQDLTVLMEGKAWMKHKGKALVDEIPGAYKDIHRVMADQADLVEIETELTQILNFKGT